MDMTKVRSPQHRGHVEHFLPGMLMNFMIYACQEARFKRLMSVKGLSLCSRGEAWTCRLNVRKGIYGIIPLETSRHDELTRVRFGLYYFPDPDEEILEHSLIAAALAAQEPTYLESVRDFSLLPDFAARFPAGELFIAMDDGEAFLEMGLRAQERRVTIAGDGVLHPSEEGYIVQPGEPEEMFPELEVAEPLFSTLAAAVSFTMKTRPKEAFIARAPGFKRIYDRHGRVAEHPLHNGEVVTKCIVWGDGERVPCFPDGQDFQKDEGEKTALFWQTHDMAALEETGDHAKAFDMRPQFIVLSGFLGSGKTTFLNQLIEYYTARNESVAVIQNEIGQTGLDGKILDGGVEAVEMDEGCVCCTLAGQLGRGIREIIKVYRPQAIVLECTGLANPMNVIKEMVELRSLVRLDSVTTMLDGVDASHLLSIYDIARDQVRAADVVVVNKCDLIEPEEAAHLEKVIETLNPRAVVTRAEYGRIPFASLYNDNPRAMPSGLMPAVPTAYGDHRDLGFSSVQIELSRPVDRTRLEEFLDACPGDIFRIKGIVRLKDEDELMVVQSVGGRWEISRFPGVLETVPFLTAIGRNMDSPAIAGYLSSFYTSSNQGGTTP